MSKSIDIDFQLLNRLYSEQGLTGSEIAKQLGLSYTCVYNNLKRHNISIEPRRKFLIPTNRLKELYLNQDMSLNRIAKVFGVGHTTVACRLQDLGIPVKSRSEKAPRGNNHYHWKGGKTKTNGYIFVRLPSNDPFSVMAKNSWDYIAEHRYIMAQQLGRCLTKDEVVHHLNGVRNDNRLCNLGIVTRSNHSHHTLQKQLQKRIRELEAELSQQALFA